MEENIVSTIDGIGIVEAKNDLITFSITVKAKGESLESSQKQVKEKFDQAIEELNFKRMNLHGAAEYTLYNYKLEHRENGERFPAGFQSVREIKWTMVVDDSINDIYKTCLKIDPHMSGPYFSIKNRELLAEQALQKAVDNAKEKLIKECALLNVHIKDLRIHNWNFGYEGYLPANASKGAGQQYYATGVTGPTGPIGPQGSMGPVAVATKLGSIYQELLDIKLEPGTVSVRVAVRVNYVWNK